MVLDQQTTSPAQTAPLMREEGIIVTDRQGALLFCNAAARALFDGDPPPDLCDWPQRLGLSSPPDCDPADRSWILQAFNAEQRLEGTLAKAQGPDHEPTLLKLHLVPQCLFDANQEPTGLLLRLLPQHTPAPARSVTATASLPESATARLFIQAVEQMSSGLVIADAREPNLPMIYVNRAFLDMTGYEEDEVIGRNCRFLQGDYTDKSALTTMRKALREQTAVDVVLRNQRKDGNLFWNHVRITPIYDEQGVVSHFAGVQQDVSSIVAVQEELRAERDFVRMALESIPSLFFMVTEHGALLAYNGKVCETSGYPADDLRHMTLLDFFSGEGRHRAHELLTAGFQSSEPVAAELMLVTQAGARIPIYIQAVRRQYQGRKVLIASGQDVSEYRNLLESLQLNQERLSRSQAFANIGLWDWNLLTNDVYWSDWVPELLGVAESKLSFNFNNLFSAVHPLDRLRLEQSLERCAQGKEVCDNEFRVQLPDGSLRWMLARANVIYDRKNRPTRMLGVVQDITALKHAEFIEKSARLQIQSIIDSLHSLICVVDESGVLHSVNRQWKQTAAKLDQQLATLAPGGDYLKLCDILGEQGRADMQRLAQGVRAVLSGAVQSHETEIGPNHPSSKDIYLVRITPLAGASEEHPQVVINHVDITTTRRIEEDLRRAKDEAERASQAKSEFLSSMSHELRTPMNAVLGFAQVLEHEDDLTDDQRESVEEILRAGKHLLELINEVLDLARIESGKIELELQTVALNEVVSEIFSLIAPLAQQRQITVKRQLMTDLAVCADRVRLKQVLINLLSNAIKYNQDQGTVSIEAAHAVEDAESITISVVDTGHGIPPDQIDGLFEPFARLSRDESQEGTGIGLAVCRRLVQAMGGSIAAVSELGVGSRFTIILPAAKLDAAPLPASVEVSSQAAYAIADAAPITVLQIEDNPANLKLMQRVLAKRPEIQLLSAHSASLGLELIASHLPDLILLDINMPGMDGYATLEVLRANPKTATIPVIALTANATARDIERGLAAGFDAYLTKPLNIVQFNETIRRLLDNHAARYAV